MITRDSSEWPGTKAWLQLQITQKIEALIACQLISEADKLRGEIRAYREIIAAVEPEIIIPTRPASDPKAGY